MTTLTTWIITNNRTGSQIGAYTADTAQGALDGMARDAGYDDHEHANLISRAGRGELTVAPLTKQDLLSMPAESLGRLPDVNMTSCRSTCIRCTCCTGCEKCDFCTDCNDCTACAECQECNECVQCDYCKECESCTDCSYCKECTDCENCVGCRYCAECRGITYATGLRYVAWGIQLTREEWRILHARTE